VRRFQKRRHLRNISQLRHAPNAAPDQAIQRTPDVHQLSSVHKCAAKTHNYPLVSAHYCYLCRKRPVRPTSSFEPNVVALVATPPLSPLAQPGRVGRATATGINSFGSNPALSPTLALRIRTRCVREAFKDFAVCAEPDVGSRRVFEKLPSCTLAPRSTHLNDSIHRHENVGQNTSTPRPPQRGGGLHPVARGLYAEDGR
jgi:hypothetical protein